MLARDPDEPHRAARPLELLFDLVFVVAVSQASAHCTICARQHFDSGCPPTRWCSSLSSAWLNFTWFASAYDTDDVPYRLTMFVQMAGALTLAVGAPRAMLDIDSRTIIIGYVIMRAAMVTQWMRAAITRSRASRHLRALRRGHRRRPGRLGDLVAGLRPGVAFPIWR